MPIPNPATFINHPCDIMLKNGSQVVKTILRIDTSGVLVQEDDNQTHLYQFAEIAEVSRHRPGKAKPHPGKR